MTENGFTADRDLIPENLIEFMLDSTEASNQAEKVLGTIHK